jgi:putative endonuclease
LEGFSSSYNCNRLVHLETYADINRAIAREKQLKRWSRTKKICLIERENPAWHDLSEDWGKQLLPRRETSAATNKTRVSPLRSASVEMTEPITS